MTYASLYARLVANTLAPENGQACWVHKGALNKPNGYPQVNILVAGKIKHFYAHRLMFLEFNAPLPEGHEVDHMCYNNRCINPDHLRARTVAHNRADNKRKAA